MSEDFSYQYTFRHPLCYSEWVRLPLQSYPRGAKFLFQGGAVIIEVPGAILNEIKASLDKVISYAYYLEERRAADLRGKDLIKTETDYYHVLGAVTSRQLLEEIEHRLRERHPGR